MPTTEQILASHEAALAEQNAFKVSTHYAKDAVAIVNGTTYRGRPEIASMYAKLIDELPDAVWRTDVAVVHGDLAYVEWACESSAASRVDAGTDTFIVVDGFITRQTARFAVIANDGLAMKQRNPAVTS
ncbi:nuclear transport factor 2 family protein [Acidovorax sp.]|uniref:nuclear transport factor 2 family protein n=1 Tax=Acidovorax sp. TaxID=1872122 RepID=UPI00391F9563